MENNEEQTSNVESRSAGRGRPLLLAGGLMLAILALGILLGRTWFAKNESAAAQPAPAEKSAEPAEAAETAAKHVHLSAEAIRSARIEIGEVGMHAFAASLDVPGRLAINEDNAARVGTFVTGRITRVLATVGDFVRKGQPLIYLHSHELVDARGDADKARAKVTEKEKALAYAKAEAERADRLLEAKAISRREQALAAANVSAAAAELEHARAELTRAAEFLEHLTVPHDSHDDIVIYAPISGIVLKRSVTLGTVASEADELMMLANLDTLWAIAEVPQQQAALVRRGQAVEMKVSGFGDAKFSGRVVHIGEQLNPETRTMQVRCLVQNPRGALRPEMFANMNIGGASGNAAASPSVVAIPRDALQDLQGERVVFLALDDGRFEKKVVQPGREQNGMIEILGGLPPGARIVTRGGFFIKTEFMRSSMAEE
ncbi:MAG: efflux RND transporter periplasmic adaptor subunit [Blastocatellia bacterium]|nr:efflux RND transporter periplasmic adaptor subunit [Blastocatellia bacterium]